MSDETEVTVVARQRPATGRPGARAPAPEPGLPLLQGRCRHRRASAGSTPGSGPGAPEDWVGSTTTSFGHDTRGSRRCADGRILRDVIDADPVGYLGPEHVARFGSNPGLLVKLLDAGERLAVHFHPGREFAREHLRLGLRQDRGVADPRRPSRARTCTSACASRSTSTRSALGQRAGLGGDARRAPQGAGRRR